MQNLFLNSFIVYATPLLINFCVTYDFVFHLFFIQILEFDLKGIALDNSSSLTIIVKDFETIGQNKYVLFLQYQTQLSLHKSREKVELIVAGEK